MYDIPFKLGLYVFVATARYPSHCLMPQYSINAIFFFQTHIQKKCMCYLFLTFLSAGSFCDSSHCVQICFVLTPATPPPPTLVFATEKCYWCYDFHKLAPVCDKAYTSCWESFHKMFFISQKFLHLKLFSVKW